MTKLSSGARVGARLSRGVFAGMLCGGEGLDAGTEPELSDPVCLAFAVALPGWLVSRTRLAHARELRSAGECSPFTRCRSLGFGFVSLLGDHDIRDLEGSGPRITHPELYGAQLLRQH